MKTDTALERGLYRSLVDSTGAIRDEAWKRAVAIGDIVGLCRRCEGLMKAVPIVDNGRTPWYAAECTSCFADIGLPARHGAGVTLRRSARHDEQPEGSHHNRIELLTRMAALAKRQAA